MDLKECKNKRLMLTDGHYNISVIFNDSLKLYGIFLYTIEHNILVKMNNCKTIERVIKKYNDYIKEVY